MLIIVILLMILLISQTIYLFYYKSQIKDIGDQLSFISEHNSFKFTQTQIKPREIAGLIDRCNTILRKQRELNQEFIHKSEEINTTIVSLSHDIRTPITSLDGYLQLAKRAEDVKEKTTYIELAESRIKQITTLVEELFLYTKLQNPAYTLELEPIKITNILKKTLFAFFDEFTKKESEPMLTLLECSSEIKGNENALERIFENIIKNYIVHGKGDLNIREEEKKGEVLIQFTNLIKHEQSVDLEQIFTRFYKEDVSRTKHSTGLGLSIVKSLMEKMTGSVQADLKDHQFSISLIFTKIKKENHDVE